MYFKLPLRSHLHPTLISKASSPYIVLFLACMILSAFTLNTSAAEESSSKWWKGNLHTHSMWSDGDDYPEMIVEWYKQHEYHFLAMTDHNVLSQGERWISVEKSRGGLKAYEKYVDRFGDTWVESRKAENGLQVRLKPFDEYRRLFEEAGKFILMQGE